jgi:hypothetical protein
MTDSDKSDRVIVTKRGVYALADDQQGQPSRTLFAIEAASELQNEGVKTMVRIRDEIQKIRSYLGFMIIFFAILCIVLSFH